jgi:hypothetical protein
VGYELRPGHRYAIAMQPRYDNGAFKANAELMAAMRSVLPDLLTAAQAARREHDCDELDCGICAALERLFQEAQP